MEKKGAIDKEILEKIREFSMQYYPRDDLHGLGHINRVLNNAAQIYIMGGKKGDWSIIEASIWLHDIGRKYENQREYDGLNHAQISALLAEPYLTSLKLDRRLINNILHAIKSHSFSLKITPETLEAKIVSDSDKLDALGAVGIFRAAAYQAMNGMGIREMLEHFHEKLLKLKRHFLLTQSMEIAQKRIEIMKDYEEKLRLEIDPKYLQSFL